MGVVGVENLCGNRSRFFMLGVPGYAVFLRACHGVKKKLFSRRSKLISFLSHLFTQEKIRSECGLPAKVRRIYFVYELISWGLKNVYIQNVVTLFL